MKSVKRCETAMIVAATSGLQSPQTHALQRLRTPIARFATLIIVGRLLPKTHVFLLLRTPIVRTATAMTVDRLLLKTLDFLL